MRLALLTLALAVTGFPADSSGGRVAAPASGFLFDSISGAIRTISGTPGAAFFSGPLDPGSVSDALISPQQDYFLALKGDRRQVVLGRSSLQSAAIPGVPDAPDSWILSPKGTAAALFYGISNTILIVTGLPLSPVIAAEYDASQLAGSVRLLALSEDAARLLAVLSAEGGASLILLGDGGTQTSLGQVGATVSAQFLGSSEAAVADPLRNEVFLIRESAGGTSRIPIASEADGIAAPAAIAGSADGRRVWVANTGSQSVISIDLESHLVRSIACSLSPSALARLGPGAYFRLTDFTQSSILVLDDSKPQPRILLIPEEPAQ
jgi:hypothetical protein